MLNPYYPAFIITIASAIIALFLFKKVDKRFIPFLIYVMLSGLIEIIYFFINKYAASQTSVLGYNIYVLLEGFVLVWMFNKWRVLDRYKYLPNLLYIGFMISWSIDLIYTGTIHEVLIFYRIFYSFVLVMLAINSMNLMIVHSKSNLLRSSKFLISSGILVLYTNKIVLESFYLLLTENSFLILRYVALFVKFILFLALLWIPKKPRKSLPSL